MQTLPPATTSATKNGSLFNAWWHKIHNKRNSNSGLAPALPSAAVGDTTAATPSPIAASAAAEFRIAAAEARTGSAPTCSQALDQQGMQATTGSHHTNVNSLAVDNLGIIVTCPYEPQHSGCVLDSALYNTQPVASGCIQSSGALPNAAVVRVYAAAQPSPAYTPLPTGSNSLGPGAVSWPVGSPTGRSDTSFGTLCDTTGTGTAATGGDAIGTITGVPGMYLSPQEAGATGVSSLPTGASSNSSLQGPSTFICAAPTGCAASGAQAESVAPAAAATAAPRRLKSSWAAADEEARQPLLPK